MWIFHGKDCKRQFNKVSDRKWSKRRNFCSNAEKGWFHIRINQMWNFLWKGVKWEVEWNFFLEKALAFPNWICETFPWYRRLQLFFSWDPETLTTFADPGRKPQRKHPSSPEWPEFTAFSCCIFSLTRQKNQHTSSKYPSLVLVRSAFPNSKESQWEISHHLERWGQTHSGTFQESMSLAKQQVGNYLWSRVIS